MWFKDVAEIVWSMFVAQWSTIKRSQSLLHKRERKELLVMSSISDRRIDHIKKVYIQAKSHQDIATTNPNPLKLLIMRPTSLTPITDLLSMLSMLSTRRALATRRHTTSTSNRAPPPRTLLRHLRIIVTDKQLAILSVTSGHLVGDLDDVEDACCFVEDFVHFFEGAVGGFWVEEVDAGDDEGVDYSEDDVGLVADCVEGDGCYHYDHEAGGGKSQ